MLSMPVDLEPTHIPANAEIVLQKRYYIKNEKGESIEDGKALFWRVASTMAEEEAKYETSPYKVEELALKFYSLMANSKFLPNSPTLMNAGTRLGQLAACFVLPIGDSIEEIFDSVKYAAMIHKSGGGTGFSFSRIRPKDSRVGTTGGVASGPLSFLRIFNTATEQIKQGGTRRGANMGILRVDHPDIMEFIKAKEIDGEFNNFNLSIGLTEDFMKKVDSNEDFDLIDPHSKTVRGTLNAKETFDLLVKKAWQSGDPGIVFLDRINRDNPTPKQGDIESTNPCGEQPLLPYEACNLGSINLAKFFLPANCDGKPEDCINWEELRNTVHLAVRFLDNVIDASVYPLALIEEKVRLNRKIGLGVMGFADLLFMLGVGYDSDEGVMIGEKLMEFIQIEGRVASAKLAEERGAFPAFEDSIFAGSTPLRNATVTTIAPTGTLSIIAACSSGVEPLFALCFAKNVMDGERLLEINPYFERELRNNNLNSPEVMEALAQYGSIKNIKELPEFLRSVYVTAQDISPEAHLAMQAAFQRHTDNAVSKTVNLENSATIEDIDKVYRLAYSTGCKGVTVYRDGSKSIQVLYTGEAEKKLQEQNTTKSHIVVSDRPDRLTGFTQKISTGLGKMYLTVNENENGEPFEVFATIGKSGRSVTAKAEAIGRLVSLALRSGIDVRSIVNQIKGIGGEHPIFQKKGMLLSVPDAIAWVLETRYLKGGSSEVKHSTLDGKVSCPECGEAMHFQEGCHLCPACSYSRCG